MKKFGCCIVLPLLLVSGALAAGLWFLFSFCSIRVQVESNAEGETARVFGTVGDTVSIPLIATGYLVSDGEAEVWVMSAKTLPQIGRHILVEGRVKKGLKLPGKLGGGALVVFLEEQSRWDFPL